MTQARPGFSRLRRARLSGRLAPQPRDASRRAESHDIGRPPRGQCLAGAIDLDDSPPQPETQLGARRSRAGRPPEQFGDPFRVGSAVGRRAASAVASSRRVPCRFRFSVPIHQRFPRMTQQNSPPRRQLSPMTMEELKTQTARVRLLESALLVWHRLFTSAERKRLGGDPAAAWRRLGAIGMWIEVREASPAQAVLEMAVGIGHMSPANYDWLRRELGIPSGSAAPATDRLDVPSWDSASRELRFGGQTIRQVRVMRKPSNVQRLLDAFQAQGWPPRIDNPLPGTDENQLNQALRQLKRNLSGITFRSQQGGKAVCWSAKQIPVNSYVNS